MEPQWREEDFLSCSGSRRFAKEMVVASPFSNLDHAIRRARDIWFNKVDVKGWLEAFAAHPEIGTTSKSISQWSREEQSAALATATDSTMQELVDWGARYKEKFGFVFLICATGKGTPEILAELKRRFSHRPIVELEAAAQEEMKIIELRLAKLFNSEARSIPRLSQLAVSQSRKPEGMRPWAFAGDNSYNNFYQGEEVAPNNYIHSIDLQQDGHAFNTQPSNRKKKDNIPWTIEEEKLLCTSRMNVVCDSAIGTDRSSAKFWDRILNSYNDPVNNKTGRCRPLESLKSHWKKIGPPCTVWRHCWIKVTATHQSGANTQKLLEDCEAMWKIEMKTSKKFILMHCWEILQKYDKWGPNDDRPSAKRSRQLEMGDYSTQATDADSSSCHKCPLDQKAAEALEKGKGQASESSISEDNVKSMTDSLDKYTERVQNIASSMDNMAKQRKIENYLKILTMDTSNIYGEEQAFWVDLKRKTRIKFDEEQE